MSQTKLTALGDPKRIPPISVRPTSDQNVWVNNESWQMSQLQYSAQRRVNVYADWKSLSKVPHFRNWEDNVSTGEVVVLSNTIDGTQFHLIGQHNLCFAHSLMQVIEESKGILDLEEDWDGAGAQPIKQLTWERAVEFLIGYATHIWKRLQVIMPNPEIGPGPKGDIDIHWKIDEFELLINIPSDVNEKLKFYGDDYGSAGIEGFFDERSRKFDFDLVSLLRGSQQ